jgi:nitrogen regulatory protein PII
LENIARGSNQQNFLIKVSMKQITIIVKSLKLDEVRAALSAIGVQGIIVTEAKDLDRRTSHTELYHGAEYVVAPAPARRTPRA